MLPTLFAVDVRTMLIVMLMSNALMAAALWFAFAGHLRDGLANWTRSLWAQALAWLLFALRGSIPDVLAAGLGNGMLALGWSLQFAAVLEFQQRRLTRWLPWAPPVVVFLLFVALTGHPQLRLAAGSLLYALMCAAIAILVVHRPPQAGFRAYRLLFASYAMAGAVLLARGIGAGLTPAEFTSPASPDPYQTLLYLVAYVLVIAGSLGFLLMQKERADEETRRLATTDPLTGVFNRRTFIELAERELARSRRDATSLSLMILDLDHFKQVNDTYGHLVGDDVLVAFTSLIRDRARRGDLVVRYGGEEFCVLLPATSLPAAVALAERIRAATAATALTAHPMKITVSVGVTAYAGGPGVTLETLLARADEALYRAKHEGRNRVVALPLAEPGIAQQRPLPLEHVG
jgi:diguanylate cyclase (GGDEF)-like protein